MRKLINRIRKKEKVIVYKYGKAYKFNDFNKAVAFMMNA